MNKVMPIAAALLLGLMVCSAVVARNISGYVYFDTAETKPARCSEVYLWNGTNCGELQSARDMTIVDISGYYEFTGLEKGYYSVKAQWGLTICAQCDTTGTECDTVVLSTCEYTVDDTTDASINLIFDIDCECEGN